MSEKDLGSDHIPLFSDQPEADATQEAPTVEYDFSAVDSFPAAELAHREQEAKLNDSRETQGMNPGSTGFDPTPVKPTPSKEVVSTHTQPKQGSPKTKKTRPLSNRQQLFADVNRQKSERAPFPHGYSKD
jgi:hypothetical protein